jgi:leucyl-tRNA synthetase
VLALAAGAAGAGGDAELRRLTHQVTRKVTGDVGEHLHFNTAVAALMEFSNNLGAYLESTPRPDWDAPGVARALAVFVQLLHPFAPHITEELWQDLGGAGSVLQAPWPTWDEAALARDEMTLVVTVNGKVRAKVTVSADASEAAARDAALAEPRIAEILAGKTPRKVIVVPGRLVNLVV